MRIKAAVAATVIVVVAVVGFAYSSTQARSRCDKCPATSVASSTEVATP